MLRIVGVQRSENPDTEFLLLQNQGSLRVVLRGHVVMAERAVISQDLSRAGHLFTEEESIHPGLYVMLSTGEGLSHWGKTKDGAHVFHAYAGRKAPIWHCCEGPFYVLQPTHTYCERAEALMLR